MVPGGMRIACECLCCCGCRCAFTRRSRATTWARWPRRSRRSGKPSVCCMTWPGWHSIPRCLDLPRNAHMRASTKASRARAHILLPCVRPSFCTFASLDECTRRCAQTQAACSLPTRQVTRHVVLLRTTYWVLGALTWGTRSAHMGYSECSLPTRPLTGGTCPYCFGLLPGAGSTTGPSG
jgi:hypothetical protein